MKRFRVYIINFIGYNKTEANATIILIGIVLLAAIAPRIHLRLSHTPTNTTETDQVLLSEWLEDIDNSLKKKEIPPKRQKTTPLPTPFTFDPNLATNTELEQLGFNPYIAARIVNYRKAGGHFNSPEDLKKIFGIDSTLIDRLHAYVTISRPPKEEKKTELLASNEEPAPTPKAPKILIDLNLATSEELQEIRGIGPFYAKNILAYRQKLGGFYSFDQLEEVYRMKHDVLDLLKGHTHISAPTEKLPINSDSMKHLAKHPYLSWNQAKVIVNYRKQHGTFTEPEELLNIKIINDSLYQKISPYISVEP